MLDECLDHNWGNYASKSTNGDHNPYTNPTKLWRENLIHVEIDYTEVYAEKHSGKATADSKEYFLPTEICIIIDTNIRNLNKNESWA